MEQEDPFVTYTPVAHPSINTQAGSMELAVDELYRQQRDVPFGWVLMLQQWWARRQARRALAHPWAEPRGQDIPDDLHHLAAPH